MSVRWSPWTWALLPLLVLLAACDGLVGAPVESQLSGYDSGVLDDGADALCEEATLPGPTPQLSRLSHLQYRHIVQDVLGVEVDAGAFAPDPVLGGFNNNVHYLEVDSRLFNDYQRAAEDVAEAVVASSNAFSRVLTCSPNDSGCAATFIQALGRRLYRRPLSAAEAGRYQSLFRAADALYIEGTTFERGARLVIQAMLQSPNFLYRPELDGQPAQVDGQTLVRLDDYAVASRLAATLWASAPDDALLDAAEAGQLGDVSGIRAQAQRMLQSSKVLRVVDDFHQQWLHTGEFGTVPKVPALPDDAGEAMRAELREFVRDIVESGGTYADLATSSFSYVNDTLADIYGISGRFGASMTRVDLDPGTRAGIFTQAGFLSTHAGASSTSPIKRGAAMLRDFFCVEIELPDFQIDPTVPPSEVELITTREKVEHLTANDTCRSCHRVINGMGFAFEHYDAVGAYRDLDNGAPVNASGEVLLNGHDMVFDGATQLAQLAVDTGMGGHCYVEKWMSYAMGRALSEADRCTATEVSDAIEGDHHPILDVLGGMAETVAFRYRLPEE